MTTDFDRSMDEIEVEIARTRARLAGEADFSPPNWRRRVSLTK